jgi:hypothetical protein
MSKKISPELQEAILEMPEKEKDKLLLRLIAKDAMLVKQLHHQLLEDESDTLQKREELMQRIKATFNKPSHYFETPGWLMMAMRDWNGEITRFVKIHKDKLGEIILTTFLVNGAFVGQKKMLEEKAHRAEKFAEYACKKADFVMKKLEKIHEDYYLELRDDVNTMLATIHAYAPCKPYIQELNLPKGIE